jgi:RNA polymerase sigma-54 factor
MKISLTTKTSQQLTLTPQLQQAIRLLQLSNLELRQELEAFSADNPLLEIEDSMSGDSLEGAGQEAESSTDSSDDWEDAIGDGLTDWRGEGNGEDRSGREDGGEIGFVSLQAHLREQVAGLHLSPRDRAWLDILIEALDEDGYVRDPLAELAEGFAEVFESELGGILDEDEMMVGLRLLQSLDPPGIGAQSLQQCLQIQLEGLSRMGLNAAALTAAQRLVTEHLDQVGQMPLASLCRACGLDRELVSTALELIRGLEPRPAARFQAQQDASLTPDVMVSQGRNGKWVVRLARQSLPRLSINSEYARLIRDGESDSVLSQKLQEARWMLKNIAQRSETILKVSQAIVSAQQAFFSQGPKAMRPMVLRDIAEACELHESTVSRVTNQKFMLTPLGCFELKFFFSSHVGTDDGGAASATALKAQIESWIKAEDSAKPLSDQALSDRFQEQGVVVARRTVAKYREALRIPSASLRKRT